MKICSKCGIEKSEGEFTKRGNRLHSHCKECRKKYREQNKDKIKQYQKKYQEANKEKLAEKAKKYREANKEKKKKYLAEYQEANKEKLAEKAKKYREANKEKIAEKNRKYNQTERGKTVRRLLEHKRRTLKTSLSFKLSKADIEHMFDYFDNSCANCGSNNNLALDHFIALTDPSCPGTVAWNIIPLCRSCNSKKYNKKPEFFFEETIYIWIQRYLLNCEVGQASYYQECRNNGKTKENSN
jgi:5-methylcytosine-specific restriction endonuclease McrA